MPNINIEKLSEDLDNCKNLEQLSKSFDNINSALSKSCDMLFNQIFQYKFMVYLYYNYLVLNKSKKEIGEELNMSQSTVYYYIHKYNLKKDKSQHTIKIQEALTKTMMDRYGVPYAGFLPETHQKRLDTIMKNSNGQYNKTYYKKLRKTKKTRKKMSQTHKRLYKEKLQQGKERNNGETKKENNN